MGLGKETKQVNPVEVTLRGPLVGTNSAEQALPISLSDPANISISNSNDIPIAIKEALKVQIVGPQSADAIPIQVQITEPAGPSKFPSKPLQIQLTSTAQNPLYISLPPLHNQSSQNISSQSVPVQLNITAAPIELPITPRLTTAELRVALSNKDTTTVRPPPSIRPDDSPGESYPKGNKINYAILSLPDPRIPRHKRAFDLGLQSVSRAFSQKDFLLDRFVLPWDINSTNQSGQSKDKNQQGNGSHSEHFCSGEASCFGLLVYRKDLWRKSTSEPLVDIWAVYVITERSTVGVDRQAFRDVHCLATKWMAVRSSNPADGKSPLEECQENNQIQLQTNIGTEGEMGTKRIPFIGPAFSGSMTSLYLALADDKNQANHSDISNSGNYRNSFELRRAPIDLFSYAASARSNDELKERLAHIQNMDARLAPSYAINDDLRLENLKKVLINLRRYKETSDNQVVMFAENSDYGIGAKKSFKKVFGTSSTRHFPPNFSQLRHELEMSDISGRGLSEKQLLRLPKRGLELDARSEDLGDEFPVQFDPQSGARSQELVFEQEIRDLKNTVAPNATIILSATEVRDRLFLARRLRSELPGALLVDMEADILLTHPDYIDATRGMLVISSASLQRDPACDKPIVSEAYRQAEPACESSKSSVDSGFATDDAALLYQLITDMVDSTLGKSAEQNAWFYRVTRLGFEKLAYHENLTDGNKNPKFYYVVVVFCLMALPLFTLIFRVFKDKARRLMDAIELINGLYARLASWVKATVSAGVAVLSLIIFILLLSFSSYVFFEHFLTKIKTGIDVWTPMFVGSALLCWIAFNPTKLTHCPPWPFVSSSGDRRGATNAKVFAGAIGVVALVILAGQEWFTSPAAEDVYLSLGLTALTGVTTALAGVLAFRATLQLARLKHGLAALNLFLKKDGKEYRPWSDFVDRGRGALDGMGYSKTPFAVSANVGPRCPDNYQLEKDDKGGQYDCGQNKNNDLYRYKYDETENPLWAKRCIGLVSGESVADFERWPDNLSNRMALRRIVSREISLLRWLCIHTTLLALFGVYSVVAFPIGALNTILSINVLYVCIVALAVVWITIDLDRNILLAMLFNGTPGKVDWKTSLVTYLAVPIIIVTLAIWAANVPGVRQWSEHAAQSIFAKIGLW